MPDYKTLHIGLVVAAPHILRQTVSCSNLKHEMTADIRVRFSLNLIRMHFSMYVFQHYILFYTVEHKGPRRITIHHS